MYFEERYHLIAAIIGSEELSKERILARFDELSADERRWQFFKWLFERRRELWTWSIPRLRKFLDLIKLAETLSHAT